MATAQKLTDHFLTCTVCHEIFTDPSTLACGHSFCGPCIVGFTKTRADAIRSKSMPCPFCRRLTKVPNPSRPVEEWAGQMRPSLLLKGLLDTIGPGTKDTTNCNWCHDEGETTPAVRWCPVCDVSLCANCLKAHRRSPSTKHHDLSDVTDELRVDEDNVKRKTKIICPEHMEEFVKRKETLMDKPRLDEEQLKSFKSRCRELEEITSSVQSKIQSTAQNIVVAVKKGNEVLDKLSVVTNKEMDQLKADIKTGDMGRDIYRQPSELLDQALYSEGEMDMYDLYKSSESEAAEPVEDVKKRGTKTRTEISQDLDGLDRALSEVSLVADLYLYSFTLLNAEPKRINSTHFFSVL